MAAHACQLTQLRAAGRFGAPAHQHHEKWHQRRSEQQDQRHHPVDPGDSGQDQQRHHHHFSAHRQEAAVIALDRITVMQHQFAQFAGAALPQPQWAVAQQTCEHAFAQCQACGVGHVTGSRLGGAAQQRAQHQDHRQPTQRWQSRGQRHALHQHLLHQPGDGGSLADQQRAGQADAQRGQALAAPGGACQVGQPGRAHTPLAGGFSFRGQAVRGRFGSAQEVFTGNGGDTAL